MAESVKQTWERVTKKPWAEAKKLGLTDGSYLANVALQKKINGGFNPYASAAPTAAAPAAPTETPEQRAVREWYATKPATPGTFTYSAEQEAADKRSVSEQYRPYYQEQADQAGDELTVALKNAREGFSRRGLWGAAAPTATTTDPNTGLATVQGGTPPPTAGGPRSGLREQGEKQINQVNDRRVTSFNRAYTEAVAGGTQNRKAEAQDIYQKTVRAPYEDQYKDWMTRMQGIQAAT